MTVTHVNRNRDTYYLHVGITKTGKPRYWFSTKADGNLIDAIPEGYEIYENPEAQVFLRKQKPQIITLEEVEVVKRGLEQYAPGQKCMVDVRDEYIVIHHAQRIAFDALMISEFPFQQLPIVHARYEKVMRFALTDRVKRTFSAQRWCYRGSIDDWIDLWLSGSTGQLSGLVKKFCSHIGKESFFELR
jgi:hypothetical protein